ncbi:hypothetical protein [Vreelandella venusta]|uniref:Uncharacterized protein n=1 Tax=Vreelandella venusta TaxID=44935 RepID=A0ABX2BCD5_9GAMM|nr:hypothetical protein [Halomonas venusta]AZM96063.1 hypothetical protein EI420_10375 [Halomonas venusta]NPT30648.1 hypothetical protein [Halomonas venusta]
MAQTYKTGLIITGDASGGIRAVRATDEAVHKLNQTFDRTSRQSKRFGNDVQQAGRQLSSIDKGAADAGRGLAVLRTNATGVAAAMATAFGAGSMIKQARMIADTDALAKSIGMATGELQAWDYAAQLAGLSGGQIGDILKDIAERIGEFSAEGTGEAAALFENLNLSIEEMQRLAPDQQLLKIAEAISTLDNRGQQISYLERLGNDATRLLPLLENNAALLREYTNEANALSVSMSQIDIERAIEANRAMAQLSGTTQGLSNQIIADLAPGFATVTSSLTDFIQESGGAANILNEVKDVATLTAAVMAGRYASSMVASTRQMIERNAASAASAAADERSMQMAVRRAAAEMATEKRLLGRAIAEAQSTKGTDAHAAALARLGVARQRAVAATAQHTVAVNANAAATQRATVAARAASGAYALIGGPLGVATLAATAFFMFRDSSDEVSSSLVNMDEPLESVIADFRTLTTESQRAALIKWGDRQEEEADKARQALAKIREELLSLGFENSSGAEARVFFDEINSGFDAVERGAQSLDTTLTNLQEQLEIPEGVMRDLRLLASEYSAGRVSADELGVRLEALTNTFNEVSEGADNAGVSINSGAPNAKTLEAWGAYNDRLRESIAASRDGGSALGAASRAMDGMGEGVSSVMRGYTAFLTVQDEVLKDQKKNQAESAAAAKQAASESARAYEQAARAAQQSAKQQADALRGIQHEMDPLTAEHDKYVERINVLDQALSDNTLTQEQYGESVRWAAEQYTRAATGGEEYEKQTESLVSTYDRHNQRALQLRDALEQINQRYRDGVINGDQYVRMIDGIRDEMYQLSLEADPTSKELARSWEEAANRINETFGDAFTGAYGSFKDFGDRLMDGVKRLIGEITYQASLEPIVIGFTTDMREALAIPGAGSYQARSSQSFGGMPSLSGMMDGGGAIASAYRAFQGNTHYAGMFGDSLAAETQSGLRAGFDSFAASGLGNAALGIGGGIAGGYAGTAIGSAVFGKNANSNYGAMGGAALGQALIPIPGLGAAIGGALGGVVDSLFGSGKKTFDFDFQQGGHYGVFGDRESELGKFGITSFSDYKLGEQQDALQALMDQIANFDNTLANAAIDTRVDAMRASIEGFTHSGPEDLFDTRLRALIDGSGALVESAIAQIVDPQQMADAFLSVLNIERVMQSLNSQVQSDVAAHLEANTTNIQGTADSLTQAISSTVLLGNSAERLNWQFDDAAGGAIHYAWSLQEAVGGLDALSGMGASYYQNYFTQAEREAELREQISETMRELGLEMPKTRDGFRALVEAQSLNTDAGTANVAALLQLESAFAQLTPAIEGTGDAASSTGEALRTQEQLSRQLLQAQGNTDALRQIEIDRLSELENAEIDNLTMMQKRLWAIEDEKVAQQEAERAQQARTREIEQEAQAWSRAREQLASFGVGIDNWIDGLKSTDKGLASPGDQLAAASAAFDEQYAKAASGDRAAMSSITQYADRFIEAQKGWSASGAQTVGTIDRVTGMLAKLPDQLTPEQFIVDGIRDVVTNELADEIERAIMDSKYTISTLIDFATNTDQLPADLRTILGEQSHRLDSTLSYLVGENQLTSELERLAIGSTNTLVATVEYITFSELADDNKRLALSSSNTMTAVVDYAVRSDLDNASRRLALESSNVYSVMIEYAIERDISAEDRHLALDSINRYTAVVEYVARSELTAGNRQLALGSLNEYDAIIDYATRNDLAGADRTLAVEHGNRYLANVDYIVGRKLTPNNRRLALQSNHNYVSVIDQVVGMALKGSDRRLALESTNRYQTIVDAVLADGISPDVRKFALSKSNSLLATVDGILESGLSHDVRTLALEDSNHFVTTLEAALADGRLSHDERALLDAQSDTIFKRLETGGLNLTPDEWAVLNAASGTRRLDLLADVAFNATDLEQLGNLDAIRAGAEGTKANTDAAKDAAKGMRVTFADHQSPTALKGIGHWLTYKHKESASGIGHKYAEQHYKWAERIGARYAAAGVGRRVDGSHAGGLPRVPFDGYLAELHKDESVLTADQSDALRTLATSGASVPKLSMSAPRDMPMPSIPLPQFPTLGNSDVLQVLQDVKRELVDTRKQNKTLHAENARLLAAANAQRGSGFLREIDAIKEGNKMLKRMQDDMALEGVRR